MTATVSPVAQDVYTAIKAFIVSVLGAGVPVNQGLGNRVAAPLPASGYVYVTQLFQERLETNLSSWSADPDPTVISAQTALKVTVQIDCYGPTSGDWAAMLQTLWRDDYGVQQLAPTCAPLYADEARQIPLIDSEGQYESRHSITATLQYNPVTVVPQTFANTLSRELINVPETYPAE
jgi:hypothetical protein